MKKIKILIISYYWPPLNEIASYRPWSWVKYWVDKNVEITVLTSKKNESDGNLDFFVEEISNLNVIEVDYDKNSFVSNLSNKSNPIFNHFKNNLKYFLPISFGRFKSWEKACLEIIQELSLKNDVVISSHGPDSCHIIASAAKSFNKSIFWVADYRDLWSQNHILVKGGIDRFIKTKSEKKTVGRYADLISTVSEDLALQLSNLLHKKTIVIKNGFDLSDEELVGKFKSFCISDKVRIVYTGSLYSGYRDPTPLLKSINNLIINGVIDENKIVVEFYGKDDGYIKSLENNSKYSKFIKFKGYVNRSEALKIQNQATLLLLLESSSIEAKGVLTGKIFEYISSGKPILCIGSDQNYEIGQLISSTGTGALYKAGQQDEIEKFIEAIVNFKRINSYEPNLANIKKYSRKTIANLFFEEIEKELKGRLRYNVNIQEY